ncbi:MAG TPA: hypothetical protein P5244_07900, partial [Syntrophales bacterium]|nr:hypothetical protein [Syntrophales bacterium]
MIDCPSRDGADGDAEQHPSRCHRHGRIVAAWSIDHPGDENRSKPPGTPISAPSQVGATSGATGDTVFMVLQGMVVQGMVVRGGATRDTVFIPPVEAAAGALAQGATGGATGDTVFMTRL